MPKMVNKKSSDGRIIKDLDKMLQTRLVTTSGPGGTVFEHRSHRAHLTGRYGYFTLRELTGDKRACSIAAGNKYGATGVAAGILTEWWRE